jgi:hypothetical protein
MIMEVFIINKEIRMNKNNVNQDPYHQQVSLVLMVGVVGYFQQDQLDLVTS